MDLCELTRVGWNSWAASTCSLNTCKTLMLVMVMVMVLVMVIYAMVTFKCVSTNAFLSDSPGWEGFVKPG